jgi:hypothetical protein
MMTMHAGLVSLARERLIAPFSLQATIQTYALLIEAHSHSTVG